MKQSKTKKILIIFVSCAGAVLLGFLYWYFLYPDRSLGIEGDARIYDYHLFEKILEKDGKKNPDVDYAILDNFVFISVNGKIYTNPTKKDMLKYGLTKDYHFHRRDIGKKLGVVGEDSPNYKRLAGLKVYYYAEFPKDENICILKLGDGYGYQFFVHHSEEE